MTTSFVRMMCGLAILAMCGAVAAQERLSYQQLLDQKGPALVTVKYLLQMGMPGEESEEMENEITAVMISPDGLLLCSNAQIGGPMGMMARMMGGMMRQMMGQDLRITPKDLKVFVGDATEGLPAKLLARDTDLDLAWIQIEDAGDQKFQYVDFSKGAKPALGDSILWIRRLDKQFDRVPVISEERIGGHITKPREYYVPSAMLSSQSTAVFGLPIFTAQGEIVGITVLHVSDEEVDVENPMGMMSQMFGMAEGMGGLILPAAEVVRATERAKQSTATEE